VTDELKAYPQDMLNRQLSERSAELSFTTAQIPSGARPLLTRDGRQVEVKKRDRLAELITVPELNFKVALLGLLFAALLGALHAMSPGHGKTIVGAYLIGSRGTARHAAFLGLTVTVTHTAGVFALGLVTLAGSQYILPEKLFPALSLVSGIMVVCVGLSQFARRLRAALGFAPHRLHHHHHDQAHDHEHDHHHHHHDHSHGHTHPRAFTVAPNNPGGK
jgi:ABC-type nickel/cobalt efflux system permease component RcnA